MDHQEENVEGIPVAEPTVALSASSPRPLTGSGLSATIADAPAHEPEQRRLWYSRARTELTRRERFFVGYHPVWLIRLVVVGAMLFGLAEIVALVVIVAR